MKRTQISQLLSIIFYGFTLVFIILTALATIQGVIPLTIMGITVIVCMFVAYLKIINPKTWLKTIKPSDVVLYVDGADIIWYGRVTEVSEDVVKIKKIYGYTNDEEYHITTLNNILNRNNTWIIKRP